MMNKAISDEQLMAFADGTLDGAATAEIEAALERDDALMARLAVFMETRARAREAMSPLLDAPVPDALRQSVEALVQAHEEHEAQATDEPTEVANEAANKATRDTSRHGQTVVPFKKPEGAGGRSAPWFLRRDLAAAATVALCIGGVVGFAASGLQPATNGLGETPDMAVQWIDFTRPGIAGGLASLESGERMMIGEGTQMSVIASFRDADGSFCREVEVDEASGAAAVAVLCDDNDVWTVRFAVATPSADGVYAPASSLEALDAYLDAIGASAPMSQNDEREALASR